MKFLPPCLVLLVQRCFVLLLVDAVAENYGAATAAGQCCGAENGMARIDEYE